MFSLFLVVSDHMFCSATLVALCPALFSARMFSFFHVVSDHLFFSATLDALCPALSSACMFSLFILFQIICFILLLQLHFVQHYLLPVCFSFPCCFGSFVLFCYSGCTGSRIICSLYVFSFPCCFRSFVLFCYSGCTVSNFIFCFIFSLFFVVSDHLFCSATLVALTPTLSSACMFSLFLVVSDHLFCSATPISHCPALSSA